MENVISNMYLIVACLRDENGLQWIEQMEGMTLSDFEVWYGNNIFEIIFINMVQQDLTN